MSIYLLALLPIFAAAEVITSAQQANTAAITWNTIILAFINVIGIGITSFVALKIAQINTNSALAVKNTQETKVTAEATAKTAEATAKTTTDIGLKVVQIHEATNGHLSKLSEALGISAEKLVGMQKLVGEMINSAKDKDATLARVRTERDVQTQQVQSDRDTQIQHERALEVVKESVKQSVKDAVIESVKEPVMEAVAESVKEPVKEAVQESFTRDELEQFLKSRKK